MPPPTAVVPPPSHLQIALPFLLTAAVSGANGLLSLLIVGHAEPFYAKMLKDAKIPEKRRGTTLQPANLADVGNWFIDASAIFGGTIGPIVGWLLLQTNLDLSLFNLIYAAAFLFSIGGFALFLARVAPAGYANRALGPTINGKPRGVPPLGPFTPVTVLIIGLNLIPAGLIFLLGVRA